MNDYKVKVKEVWRRNESAAERLDDCFSVCAAICPLLFEQ